MTLPWLVFLLAISAPAETCSGHPVEQEVPACLLEFGYLPAGFLPGVGNYLQVDLEELRTNLGPARSWVVSEPFPEHYTGDEMRRVTATFPNIEIEAEFYTANTLRKATIVTLTMTRQVELPCGLTLGKELKEFRKAFGVEPLEVEGNRVVFDWKMNDCYEGSVGTWLGKMNLYLTGSQVTKIQWHYHGC
jgi:hypothetical protein